MVYAERRCYSSSVERGKVPLGTRGEELATSRSPFDKP
jgi:hypothetical protein